MFKTPSGKWCWYVCHHNKVCFCFIGQVSKLHHPPHQKTIQLSLIMHFALTLCCQNWTGIFWCKSVPRPISWPRALLSNGRYKPWKIHVWSVACGMFPVTDQTSNSTKLCPLRPSACIARRQTSVFQLAVRSWHASRRQISECYTCEGITRAKLEQVQGNGQCKHSEQSLRIRRLLRVLAVFRQVGWR